MNHTQAINARNEAQNSGYDDGWKGSADTRKRYEASHAMLTAYLTGYARGTKDRLNAQDSERSASIR